MSGFKNTQTMKENHWKSKFRKEQNAEEANRRRRIEYAKKYTKKKVGNVRLYVRKNTDVVG